MLMSNDLRCASCDYTEIDAIYERNDGPPVCPDCGEARTVDWSTGRAPAIMGHGVGSFVPVDMLGKCETREDFDRAKATIEARFPGHRIELETETRSEKQTRLDAIRHRSWLKKKANGLDDRMIKEIKAEKASAPANHEVVTKSAGELAGGA